MKASNASQEKEIESLRKTLDDLNAKLIEKETIQNEHDKVVAGLKDELTVLLIFNFTIRLNGIKTRKSAINSSVFNSSLLKKRPPKRSNQLLPAFLPQSKQFHKSFS